MFKAEVFAKSLERTSFVDLMRPAEETNVLVEVIRFSVVEKPRIFQMAISELFQDVILKTLEKRREERFQNPEELFHRLLTIEKVIGFTGII